MADNSVNDKMLPSDSPNSVKSGVRRVNNMPLIFAILALMFFAGLIAVVAVKRSSNESTVQPQTAKKNTDTSAMAKEIIGGHSAGLIPSEESAEDLVLPIEPVSHLEPQPLIDNKAPIPVDPHEQQMRLLKMQEFQDAVKAKTAIAMPDQLGIASKAASATMNDRPQTREAMLARIADVRRQMEQQNSGDPNRTYLAQLANVQKTLDGSAPSLSQTTTRHHDNSQQFENLGQDDRWKLNQKVQIPNSRFEIRAGSVIPGIMISGVNSDLPGQITGQVAQDVYDTATGKYLLIPQGTRLIGTYSSDIAYGQSAVMIAWQRLGFPDGKVLDISSMPGADSAGYTGFRDEVNNHYFRIFASALLLSGVTAGISYSQNQNTSSSSGDSQQPTVSNELSKALGQQLGQVTAQMIAKNMNIAPTLEIRPGYRFNIIVVKDLEFVKPYQSFDY